MSKPSAVVEPLPDAVVDVGDAEGEAEEDHEGEEDGEDEEEGERAEDVEEETTEMPKLKVARSQPKPPKVAPKQAAKKVPVGTKASKVPESKATGKTKQGAKKVPQAAKVSSVTGETEKLSLESFATRLAAKQPALATRPPGKTWSLTAPLPSAMAEMDRFLSWPS